MSATSSVWYESLLTTPTVIGDRERCLQAGMDDHITSKHLKSIDCNQELILPVEPLRRADLLNAITKLAGKGREVNHI